MNAGCVLLLLVSAALVAATVVGVGVELVSRALKRDFARRHGVDPDDYC